MHLNSKRVSGTRSSRRRDQGQLMRVRLASLSLPVLLVLSFLAPYRPLQAYTGGLEQPNLPANYDPRRDPANDLRAALGYAQQTHRRILIEVGGDWCIWYHIMDRFFDDHGDLKQLRDSRFVLLKVNFSPQHENREFLKGYPHIPGYPHIFVLEPGGKLLRSEDTSELEDGRSYNWRKFRNFPERWSLGTPGA